MFRSNICCADSAEKVNFEQWNSCFVQLPAFMRSQNYLNDGILIGDNVGSFESLNT